MIAQHLLLAAASTVGASIELAAADDYRRLRSRSHAEWESEWLDKPTNHPTTHGYFFTTSHYENYANNPAHPHHFYFQGMQDGRPDYDHAYETYHPTSSPTPGVVIPTRAPSQPSQSHHLDPVALPTPSSSSNDDPSDTWEVLNKEHFLHGFGVFQEVDPEDTHHYDTTLGRMGVVQLKKSSSLPSYAIAVDSNKKLKVAFSFYANNMTEGEGFCLEYSINDDDDDDAEWHPVRCWQSSIDFENSKWNDDFNVDLNLDDSIIQVDSLRIKFESISSREEGGEDDVNVMFDHITFLQS